MTSGGEEFDLADLADGVLSGPEWQQWLTEHPDLAAQVRMARQVRALLRELRTMPVEVPARFELALMERLRRDDTLLGLLDLWLAGFGRTLLELLGLLFGDRPESASSGMGN
jgi:hypothetical protein